MKPYYRDATVKDAALVAKNIRDEDRAEIEGLGHTVDALIFSVLISKPCIAFFNHNDVICGIAGISPDPREGVGIIWMICTKEVTTMPIALVKQAKQWLSELQGYNMLWNVADTRNHLHHKLLKLLGFTAIRSILTEPYKLPYFEIIKLCAYPRQQLEYNKQA